MPLADKPEVVRIAAVVEALATPLKSFPTLLTYAQAAQSLARGRDHPAVQELQSLAGPENRVEVAGISVPVPFAMDADLVFIHGFWSSPATWDRLVARVQQDPDLAGLRIHAFGYESPKLRWPGSPTQIPDYNDIAQSLPAYLAAHIREGAGVAIVTHSQGGLILQRYLAWMLAEGRGRELAKIRLIVMLSCPNEGSEYLRSIRAVAGLGRRPQAGQLDVLTREVGETRRVVLRQIINATTVDGRHCPIPVYVYSGRTDNVVLRETAQSVFPNAEVLPGDHFSILDPDAPGNLTFAELKRRLLETFTAADNKTGLATAPRGDDGREGIAPPSTVDDDADPGGERVVNEPGPGSSQAAIAAAGSSPGDAAGARTQPKWREGNEAITESGHEPRLLRMLIAVEKNIRLNLRIPFSREVADDLRSLIRVVVDHIVEDLAEASVNLERPVTGPALLRRLKEDGENILDDIEPYAMLADHYYSPEVVRSRLARPTNEVSRELDEISKQSRSLKRKIVNYLQALNEFLAESGLEGKLPMEGPRSSEFELARYVETFSS